MLKTCANPGTYRLVGDRLRVQVGWDAIGRALQREYDVVTTSACVSTAYDEMASLAGLSCAPRLVTVASAHDMGGFFTSGLVVVGQRDVDAILLHLLHRHGPEVHARVAAFLARQGQRLTTPAQWTGWLREYVVGRALAHELGHAMHAAGHRARYADREAAADFVAGQLDALRGRDEALGALLFATLGCAGPRCDHPRPATRAEAYRAGHAFQRTALAA